MRFAVVGAGAIGAFVGAMLARSGEDVTLIARGAHLRAMQERGVRVRGSLGEFEARPAVTDDPASVGVVDVALLTLKAHSLIEMAPRLTPLLGPETCVVSAQNGIPWWYFYHHGGEWEGTRLETVDPGGVISRHLDPARAIGCVVYPSTIIAEPGVVEHIEGTRLAIGEPDGSKSERCRRIADAFIKAGLRCPIRADIRHDMWVKLMGNVAFNPISALTRATLVEIIQCPETRALAAEIMTEAEAVAKRLGLDLGVSAEQRIEGAVKVGHHKTSMLQDVEAGRPLELEAIVGAVVELGGKMGLSLPGSRAVYACVKLLAQGAPNRMSPRNDESHPGSQASLPACFGESASAGKPQAGMPTLPGNIRGGHGMTAPQNSDPGAARWRQLAACIFAMLAVANLQYAWTLFTPDLTRSLNASLKAVQLTLTIFVIAQTALFPINAYLVERFGPRIVVALASGLVGAGWIGAGLANSLPALYLAYGIGGIGAGAVYSATIGIAMKWFPDRRGLCVGLVAGSYGFGTALTGIPIEQMIKTSGYQSAFIFWGVVQGIVVLVAAQFLRLPPAGWAPLNWEAIKAKVQRKVQQSSRDYTPKEMLRSGSFYLLYLMMTLVTASGLMMVGQLKPICDTYGFDKYALFGGFTVLTLTLLLNQVLNGAARPFFGWVSDHLGRYDTMAMVFILEAVAITALAIFVNHPIWFVALSGLMFFAWGDIYSLFPAAIGDIFGSKHATTNYGIQYTSKGVGSILGLPGAAWLVEATGSWAPVFWTAVACNIIAAALAVFWLKPRVTRMIKQQAAAHAEYHR